MISFLNMKNFYTVYKDLLFGKKHSDNVNDAHGRIYSDSKSSNTRNKPIMERKKFEKLYNWEKIKVEVSSVLFSDAA